MRMASINCQTMPPKQTAPQKCEQKSENEYFDVLLVRARFEHIQKERKRMKYVCGRVLENGW